ncbi:MAG: DUF1015 domain-containing protein [Deltaproteobacteria bacterium]|nr:DUF1015 domain-containing protein [Deltaproteobacteria bacterium]
MDLRPFRTLRYDPTRVRLADVVAPPYDVIDDEQRDVLYARSPHNVVRLILNREADRYAAAARCLHDWISTGRLRQDTDASLWLYVQNFTHGDRHYERTGIIGTVRLEPFSSGRIRPHERTLSGPKQDRLRLLEACRANLSPIFGLYASRLEPVEHTCRAATAGAPHVDLSDEFGVRHRLWPLAERAQVNTITAALAAETIFIADGHHRYETALEYRDQLQARGALTPDDPANFIMIYLCSMADPGLLVLPTHRLVRSLPRFSDTDFSAALTRSFRVRNSPNSATGRAQLTAALTARDELPQLGVIIRSAASVQLISPLSNAVIDDAAPELPAVVRRLDVSVLDRLILREILHLDADTAARAGQLCYSHNTEQALASVDSGDTQVVFLLGSPDLGQVQAVCLSGETMPQKSTYFHPKLLSGLVFHPLTTDLAALVPQATCARTA